MTYIQNLLIGAVLASTFSASPLQAAYTFRDGKIIDAQLAATMPMDWHYNAAVGAMEACDWRESARQFAIVASNFPLSPYGHEALFYQGVAEFNFEEYDCADQAFSDYLQSKNHPRLFDEAIEYKYAIAEKFRSGARRRLLGTKRLPKWANADGHALKIYEEIIAAVPTSELAVQSLYSKGFLHWNRRECTEAVECFQIIIRRFPKHELAPECYLMINQVYLDQSRYEFQNPDILAFAEINVRRFAQSFPTDERVLEAEQDLLEIKEVYAQGLYNTGQFYERTNHPYAAILYYRNAVIQFPETRIAQLSQERLGFLGYEVIGNANDEPCVPASEEVIGRMTEVLSE
ncbi:MAG: tetratricopeptide repeat protein [Parachlamydiaceae bacterium]|nr:tetratricopeptide repeat protein [Parachlamydiaceae bacterium]